MTNNDCPPSGAPFSVANLGQACEAAGLTWRAYCEDLPDAGSTTCSESLYARKHAPWTYFTNVNHTNERPYSELASDVAANRLPDLAVIVPNDCHNGHDSSTPGCSASDADAWLETNLPPLIAAVGQDGVVILTWDEGTSSDNHVLTVLVGSHVTPRSTYDGKVTHYTVLRTICGILDIPAFGAARSETPVPGIWSLTASSLSMAWGRLENAHH